MGGGPRKPLLGLMRGEPFVRKLALVSKYGVLPGAMIAALIYSPPNYGSSSKNHTKSTN